MTHALMLALLTYSKLVWAASRKPSAGGESWGERSKEQVGKLECDFKPIEYYISGIGPVENAKMVYDSQISFTLDTICPW
jgi:hypothetical protein